MGAPKYGQWATQHEKERRKLVTTGTQSVEKAFQGYTPEWYEKRATAYRDYARPELARQFGEARNAQLFGLANRGILGGSASQQEFSKLNRRNIQGQQEIYDTGQREAMDLKRQVEAQKSGLLGMIYASSDPASATAQASQSAAQFAPQSTIQPIAGMFNDISQMYWNQQMMNQYRQGMTAPTYSYTPKTGAAPLPPTSSGGSYGGGYPGGKGR